MSSSEAVIATVNLSLCETLHKPRLMPHTPFNVVAFIGLCPVLAIVCLFGFFGNTLSFLVMFKDKRRHSSSFLMEALAIADNAVLLFFILYFVIPTIYEFTEHFPRVYDFHIAARNYTSFGLWFSKTVSIYIVVFMTVERCVVVCLPLRAVRWCTYKNATIGLVVVVVFSLAYNIPKLWYYYPVEYQYDPCFGYERPVTRRYLQMDPLFSEIYIIGLYFVIIFIVPLSLLIVLNALLIHALVQARETRGAMTTARSGNKITERIVGVVTAFVVLEFPALVANAVFLSEHKAGNPTLQTNVTVKMTYVLSAANSFINFYIYCLVGGKFRKKVLVFLRCVERGSGRPSSMSRTVSTFVDVNGTRAYKDQSLERTNSATETQNETNSHGTVDISMISNNENEVIRDTVLAEPATGVQFVNNNSKSSVEIELFV